MLENIRRRFHTAHIQRVIYSGRVHDDTQSPISIFLLLVADSLARTFRVAKKARAQKSIFFPRDLKTFFVSRRGD